MAAPADGGSCEPRLMWLMAEVSVSKAGTRAPLVTPCSCELGADDTAAGLPLPPPPLAPLITGRVAPGAKPGATDEAGVSERVG